MSVTIANQQIIFERDLFAAGFGFILHSTVLMIPILDCINSAARFLTWCCDELKDDVMGDISKAIR